jgi:hypothetical protein
MAKKQYAGYESTRRRLPLSVRLSLLILFAALLPLAAVVGINDYSARGTLVQQGQSALTTDLNSNASRVDTYLNERIQDTLAISSLPTAPAFLLCVLAQGSPQLAPAINAQVHCTDQQLGYDFYKGSNCRALNVGVARESTYTQWSLFSATGVELLSHVRGTTNDSTCTPAGGAAVPREDLLPVVQQHKSWISAVYFDAKTQHSYVQVYSPVVVLLGGTPQVIGFNRATLNLDDIDAIVKRESGANGTGSYAFIADENGVRVVDANLNERFSALRPLTAPAEQLVTSELRFGTSPMKIIGMPSSSQFQYVRSQLTNVPWTYYVLSPLSTVTQVADAQLRTSLLSAAVIAVIAILLGLFIGRRTARPVHVATENLQGAASALKLLASRQESSASEQQWVVDACRTGLDGVRYLSDAMNQAARRIIDASNWFGEYWDRLTEEQARRTVQHLQELARYIDEAARRQHMSSDRLGKAITVTTQVSDQLVNGASAAKRSADQLEAVVGNLQRVVGGRVQPLPELEQAEQMEQAEPWQMGPAPTRGGRLELPTPDRQPMLPAPRQMAAPASPRSQLGGGMGPLSVAPGYSQVPEQWQQMGGGSGLGSGRAPRAPQSPFGAARRPGQSQVFDGGPSYPGPYSDPRAGGSGYRNGSGSGRSGNGYDRDARLPGRPSSPSRIEWDEQ